jgi:hypothetical protein
MIGKTMKYRDQNVPVLHSHRIDTNQDKSMTIYHNVPFYAGVKKPAQGGFDTMA